MSGLTVLRRDQRGAAAIEFALAVPILITLIYGIFRVGLLYEANAGMQHALGEGARYATLYDPSTTTHVPSNANIQARMTSKLFGRGYGTFTVATPTAGTGFRTLSVSYTTPMNFLFFPGPTVTVTRTKKVYVVA